MLNSLKCKLVSQFWNKRFKSSEGMKESKGFKSDHSPFFLLDLAAVVQSWSLVLATGSGSLTHEYVPLIRPLPLRRSPKIIPWMMEPRSRRSITFESTEFAQILWLTELIDSCKHRSCHQSLSPSGKSLQSPRRPSQLRNSLHGQQGLGMCSGM